MRSVDLLLLHYVDAGDRLEAEEFEGGVVDAARAAAEVNAEEEAAAAAMAAGREEAEVIWNWFIDAELREIRCRNRSTWWIHLFVLSNFTVFRPLFVKNTFFSSTAEARIEVHDAIQKIFTNCETQSRIESIP